VHKRRKSEVINVKDYIEQNGTGLPTRESSVVRYAALSQLF